jgi:hypothetical protein
VQSERKGKAYFRSNDFLPTCKQKILENKTVIPYWYKSPDELIKNQINEIEKEEDLEGLESVKFTVGGNHGCGKVWMTFKILLKFSSKATISRLYQITSVEHSKDETTIFRKNKDYFKCVSCRGEPPQMHHTTSSPKGLGFLSVIANLH